MPSPRTLLTRLSAFILSAAFLLAASAGWAAGTVVRVEPQPDADLVKVKAGLVAKGATAVMLLPEGTLLAIFPAGDATVPPMQGVLAARVEAAPAGEPTGVKGMGERPPTAEERKLIDARMQAAPAVEPNDLARARALLDGDDPPLPSSVDNSVSIHFPPIRSQGSQGSCTAWAAGYYYNTYTQAMDEGLTASGGNNANICSPAFLYNLSNGGVDNGGSTQYLMALQNTVGCSNWTLMPYAQSDWTTWPAETAWVDGLRRRTQVSYAIGGYSGCDDAAVTAIKQHLANGYIASTRTDVYNNWYNYYPANREGINNQVLFGSAEGSAGGHGMTIVGYDDNKSYFDGTTTRYGAFLIANSWGSWGIQNAAGQYGFMWVAYEYFKADNDCFGMAWFNSDRPAYRSRLYAVTGMNHTQRGYVGYRGGFGTPASPVWTSSFPVNGSGGIALGLTDARRVAVDLSECIPSISDYAAVPVFVRMGLTASATGNGTITSAVFYHDLDANGSFIGTASTDPTVTVVPGGEGFATAVIAADNMTVDPLAGYAPAGPWGGPVATAPAVYTLGNTGGVAVTYTATASQPWVTLSKPGGTVAPSGSDTVSVSVNSAANALTPGVHTATVTFTNTATNIPQTRDVSLTIRGVDTFSWGPMPASVYRGRPLDVVVTALDSTGARVNGFGGTAGIAAQIRTQRNVLTQTGTWDQPLNTYWHDSRTQCIYLASELGAASPITALALNVTTLPGQTLNNWTIRMKHTSAASHASIAWESDGWTVVYQNNETITSTGWNTFVFSTPFPYDGVGNVMIDFSHNNTSWTSAGGVAIANAGAARSVYAFNDSTNGDPLAWSGTGNPVGSLSSFVPLLRLTCASPLTCTPTASTAFTSGQWTGSVRVTQPGASVALVADDGANHLGVSSTFDVLAESQPPTSQATMSDPTLAGTTTIPVNFSASDPHSGVQSTALHVRAPGDAVFSDTGLSLPGTSGTFSYTASAGDGRYEFATRATDWAENAQAAPTAAQATALLNTEANSTFTHAAVAETPLLFPMTSDRDVAITFAAGVSAGSVTVSRTTPRAAAAAFRFPGLLLDESLEITGSGLGAFSASLEWEFDGASAAGLGSEPLDAAFRVVGGEVQQQLPATRSGNKVTVNGVTGFSTWYAGNGTAVPVVVSEFSVE